MQLIKALEAARGNGTSMISLILPPKDQVCVRGLLLSCAADAWGSSQAAEHSILELDHIWTAHASQHGFAAAAQLTVLVVVLLLLGCAAPRPHAACKPRLLHTTCILPTLRHHATSQ